MKIFNNIKEWSSKVNFVDENNVFVGYDLDQDCCEYADWFISDKPENEIQERVETSEEMGPWRFDRDYFQEVENSRDLDEGRMVRFRLTNGKEEKFLHLFNCHNGYYSHGFTFGVGDTVEYKGSL